MSLAGWHELNYRAETLARGAEEMRERARYLLEWVDGIDQNADSPEAQFPAIALQPLEAYGLANAREQDRLDAIGEQPFPANETGSELDSAQQLVERLQGRISFLVTGLELLEKATDWIQSFGQQRVEEAAFLEYRTRCRQSIQTFLRQVEDVLRQASLTTQTLARLHERAERLAADSQDRIRRASEERRRDEEQLAHQAAMARAAADARQRAAEKRTATELADIVKGNWTGSFRDPLGREILQQISVAHHAFHKPLYRARCPMLGWECSGTWKPVSGRQISVEGFESPAPGMPAVAPMRDTLTIEVVSPDRLKIRTLQNAQMEWTRS